MNMELSVSKLGEGMVKPWKETPSGMLGLSLIDALPAMRAKVRSLHVFKHGPNAAAVIRAALSKALVHYYPLAGRLVESPLLQLDCTGEGIWFVEASVRCSLEAVDYLDSDFMGWRLQLLPHSPPEEAGFDPLVLVQVTQFTCEGFVMALEFSHCVCDGLGAAQFIKAVGESARGLQFPTIPPVWCREALPAPPLAQAGILKQQQPPPPPLEDCKWGLEHTNVDMSPDSIARLKRQFLELTGKHCSTFEALVARVWRLRAQAITTTTNNNNSNTSTAALAAADDNAALVFLTNVRGLVEPPLPQGYYGNCVFPVIVSLPLDKLRCATQVEAVKLIQEAKAKLPNQFTKWMAMIKARTSRTPSDDDHDHNGDDDDDDVDPFRSPPISYAMMFVSEWGRLGFGDVDYGWGPAINLLPVHYSSSIAVCILGSPPLPQKGVRLMTWCVDKSHLNTFRQLLNDSS